VRKLKPALQSSDGRSAPWSGARLVNCFAEQADGDKIDLFAIMATPGLTQFANIDSLPVRGIHRMGETLYAVIGTTLYSIAVDGTETALGAVGGDKPVRIVDNGTELAIHGGALGKTGYVYSGGVLYSNITNLPDVTDVGYIDSYFVWTIDGGDQFIISGNFDGMSYDPLDVATVEGSPDRLIGCIVDHRELLFFGTDTVEVWYNNGGADFPFSRQGNAFIERGCLDRNSIVKIDNGVHFVGDDRIIYRLDGYQPTRISTHAIEYKIRHAAWFRGWTYSQEGHKFFVLNTDLGTWAFDMATGAWAERQSYGLSNYRIGCATTAYGKTIFADNRTGKLYIPDLDTNDEDGEPIQTIIELPAIEAQRERVTLYAFEAYMESGVGNEAVTDPQIIMQYTKDGGRTWSNELWRSMGKVGEYLTRAIWRPNVEFRQLQIRLTMPDRCRRFMLGFYADVR